MFSCARMMHGSGALLESVECAELGSHPAALPNLLRASVGSKSIEWGSVAFPSFTRSVGGGGETKRHIVYGDS